MGIDPEDAQLGKAEYSPYLDQGYPDRVYFGDTHLHTSYSTDAGMFGTRLGERERDAMQVEWGQLKLEQSTWATHERIERLAHDKLGLHTPATAEVVLVSP